MIDEVLVGLVVIDIQIDLVDGDRHGDNGSGRKLEDDSEV